MTTEWKSLHQAFIERRAIRLQRQCKLLDRLGLPELSEKIDEQITDILALSQKEGQGTTT